MLTWLGAAWLAVGMAATAPGATIPLAGVVVDVDGHPVAGASIWLGDTFGKRPDAEQTLATAETDAEGRFSLQRPDDMPGRGASWSPTLWAYKPGFRVAHLEFKWGPPPADKPVRLTLGPTATFPVRVLRSNGKPAEGARVRPIPANPRAPRPPAAMLDRLTVATDADGRATLDGFAPHDVPYVDVTMGDDLVQCLVFRGDSRVVELRPLGRITARIVAGDPKAPLKGWRVTVTSRPIDADLYGDPSTHWRLETTGDDGRIAFAPMARGKTIWSVEPPEGSDYVLAKPPEAVILVGKTAKVDILVRRGVRVEGVVRLDPGGAPIPGVKVALASLRPNFSPSNPVVETDAQGRFSAVVLPGNHRFSLYSPNIPGGYYLPSDAQSQGDFTVKEDEGRHEIDLPPLRKAALVVGKVIDENGQPQPGASVTGVWITAINSGTSFNAPTGVTDARGEFSLGNIAPGAKVRVTANLGLTHESAAVDVPNAGEGGPLTIQLKKKPTRAITGRIVDADGRPLANALIQVMVRRAAGPTNPTGGSVFEFEGSEEVRTDADGRYQTPNQIPTDLDCRIEATATGWEPGATRWLAAAETDAEPVDLRLGKKLGARELTGRVVNSFGQPIAGAAVLQSLDQPKWEQAETDADGRFTLPNVPNIPTLVFASTTDYQFIGRRVEPDERSVEFTLRSFAEPPLAPLRPVPSPVARDEERAIARELVARAREDVNEANQGLARQLDEIEAWIDPDRVVAMIENQARDPQPNVLEAAAVGRSGGDPAAILQFVDAIADPAAASTVALNLFDRLGPAARSDFRRELLERAERRGRELQPPASPADLFAQIANRRLDLGETEKGAALVREAQKLIDPAGLARFSGARNGLILALARVDPAEAVKLVDAQPQAQVRQPSYLDQLRFEIAKRIVATHPDEARRLLEKLPNPDVKTVLRPLRLRLARTDLEAARAFGSGGDDPLTDALLPAIAARARATTDPAAARDLLRESVDALAKLGWTRPNEPSAAVILARLLPLAIRIDPDRAPGMMWLALARRPGAAETDSRGSPIQALRLRGLHQELAELAALIARYDRRAAEVVFAPVAARFGDAVEGGSWGLGNEGVATLAAAATFDPRAAKAIVDAIPDDPPPPKPGESGIRRNDKFLARTTVARTLGPPPALRLREPFQPRHVGNEWVEAIED